MFHRQKVLLGLLETFGGELTHTDLQKYLFLYTQHYEKKPSYEFIPYKYGCFSFQSQADINKLIQLGYVEDIQGIQDARHWKLARPRTGHNGSLAKNTCEKLDSFRNKYGGTSD